MNNTINPNLCKNCQLCIEVCPCNIIATNENKEVYFIKEREHICLQCGQCMTICNNKAIIVNGFSYEKDFIELPQNNVDYENFINFLSTRRSVRNFKDKAVPDELLDKILDSISFTPYGSEPKKMHTTVINNRKKIAAALPYISEFLDKIVKWVDNPIMSFIIKRKKGQETFNTLRNHLYPIAKSGNYKLKFGDRITRGAPSLIIFHADKAAEEHSNNALIYATYAILTAHSLGLGATMVGLVPAAVNKVGKVREIFQIPKENEAVISVIIGYPKYKYKRSIVRRNENIHWIR